jgi:release factor glutamine methyltransferase
LVSGMEGLDAIQIIADTSKAYLKPNGLIMIEHGFLQAVAVRQILTTQGYKQIHSIRDLSNHERLTVGQF